MQSIIQNIKPKRLPHHFTRHHSPRRNPQHTQLRANSHYFNLTPGPPPTPVPCCLCKSIIQNIKPKRLPHHFTRHPSPRRNPQHTKIRAKSFYFNLTPGPPPTAIPERPRDIRV
ncbi:hypothetical protein CEXT_371601 [Caerostris extrusa]|uniref:C2H2-type domain-containing protein n=1 Tax=Caerostris extrusa TaxID=172846 RepID=A0AAV4PV75_CAEEX|nr:hypothetical protein CEXT_371601 [Caerostris extrusa]